MSYKTKLQTNNDNLEGNNIDLQSILNTINELPAAGEGIDISDATAIPSDILSGKIAYGVNGRFIGTIPSQEAKTITPKATSQTAIAAGTYASGAVTVAGDADLVADNIKKGVSIFGVDGSYTSDATATAADIASGKTAYVNGEKVTGSMVVQSYYVSNVAPSSTLGNDGDLCLVRAGE